MSRLTQPDAQFVSGLAAGLAYWQQQTTCLDETVISALDAQRQNIHRIVTYGLALPQTWRDTAVVVLQVFDLVEQRGYWLEWIPMLEQSVNCLEDKDDHLKLKLQNRLGQAYRLARQLPAAIATHQAARTTAVSLNDQLATAIANYNLAEDYLLSRDYSEADEYGMDALNEFIDLPDTGRWRAATLNTLGMVAHARGDLTLAEERLSRAAALRRSLNDLLYLARVLTDLATVWQAAGKLEQAEQCLLETAAILAPTVNEFDKVMVYNNLGVLYSRQTQWAKAEVAYHQADSDYLRQSRHLFYRAMVAHNLGEVLYEQSRLEEALSYLWRSEALWREVNDSLLLANTLGVLGHVLLAQGQREKAENQYQKAVTLLESHPNDTWANQLLKKMAAQLANLRD